MTRPGAQPHFSRWFWLLKLTTIIRLKGSAIPRSDIAENRLNYISHSRPLLVHSNCTTADHHVGNLCPPDLFPPAVVRPFFFSFGILSLDYTRWWHSSRALYTCVSHHSERRWLVPPVPPFVGYMVGAERRANKKGMRPRVSMKPLGDVISRCIVENKKMGPHTLHASPYTG